MSWEPPGWAEGKSIDQQVSEYCRRVGEVQPVEGPVVVVEIAQLEEIDRMADEPAVMRSDPILRIKGCGSEWTRPRRCNRRPARRSGCSGDRPGVATGPKE